MKDCIFCKIVKREAPAEVVYEDDKYLAFLSIRPLNAGHTLVIPKKHYRWVWDVENVGEYYKVVSKIANAMKKALNTEYIISFVFGEEVPHAHTWLVPRYEDDGHGETIDFDNIKNIEPTEMTTIAKRIQEAIKE